MSHFFSSEKSLDLSLCRRITFLHLCTTGINRLCGMCLRRTGCTAAAVTSCSSAEQDDDIARIRSQSLYGTSWGSSHHCTDLHTFCHIVRMIDLLYITGCKADLVTVGTVAVCRSAYQFFLRKFSLHGIFDRNRRVCCSGHTHCLIYISTSGKRVTDRTAKTGCCTTERFDLRRMVMSLIFKIDKPLLCHTVHLDRHNDRAGIDFLGLL